MSTTPTAPAAKLSVYIGIEDKVHAGKPLFDHLAKKYIEAGKPVAIKIHPLAGGDYKSMAERAANSALKPAHHLRFLVFDSDRHIHGREKHPPSHYSKNGFIALDCDPCAECVVLRLKGGYVAGMRTGGCTATLGSCTNLRELRGHIGDADLAMLATEEPLKTIIAAIDAKLVTDITLA